MNSVPETNPSLCARCALVRAIQTEKGSTFLRCMLSKKDDRYAKYPPQPVLRCDGYREH